MTDELNSPHARFPTTHWSLVVRAAGTDQHRRAALAELCADYWYPVYAFIRRSGHSSVDALDLTQAYFVRLLERGAIARANPERGRFRAFLRADCRHFLADTRARASAQKRGAHLKHIPLNPAEAESRYRLDPAHDDTPERAFDRAWACTLLDQAMTAIQQHYEQSQRGDLFRAIQPVLAADPIAPPYAEIARPLGMTAASLQVAVHRARARFRQALRDLIAATLNLPTSAAIDDEIRGLFQALSA